MLVDFNSGLQKNEIVISLPVKREEVGNKCLAIPRWSARIRRGYVRKGMFAIDPLLSLNEHTIHL